MQPGHFFNQYTVGFPERKIFGNIAEGAVDGTRDVV
jgi:hypothetical protein